MLDDIVSGRTKQELGAFQQVRDLLRRNRLQKQAKRGPVPVGEGQKRAGQGPVVEVGDVETFDIGLGKTIEFQAVFVDIEVRNEVVALRVDQRIATGSKLKKVASIARNDAVISGTAKKLGIAGSCGQGVAEFGPKGALNVDQSVGVAKEVDGKSKGQIDRDAGGIGRVATVTIISDLIEAVRSARDMVSLPANPRARPKPVPSRPSSIWMLSEGLAAAAPTRCR